MVIINNYISKTKTYEIITKLQTLNNTEITFNKKNVEIKILSKLAIASITKEIIGILLNFNIKYIKIYNNKNFNTLLVIDNKKSSNIYIKIENLSN